MDQPEVSLVVRAFNEQKHLPRLLESLKQQTYRGFEVIVVDSGSYDRTPEIALEYGAKLVRIDSRDFTFGYSLNMGIRNSVGSFIAIASAHTEPLDSFWLGRLVEPLRAERVVMTYGRQVGGPYSNFAEAQDFHRTFGMKREKLKPPRFFANNANSAIRRDFWEKHPFDETLPGLEDIEWAKYWTEQGYYVVYEPGAAVHHIHEESWRQIRRRYYREAVAGRWIGLKGRRHVFSDAGREAVCAFLDLGRVLGFASSRRASGGGLLECSREVILFRVNKAIGTMIGLLDGSAMRNPAAREDMFFDRRYKAVVIQGKGKASLEELPVEQVKPGDVLIQVAYEGVCATDLEIFHGTLGYYKSGVAKYPIVPGHEFSGRVVRVGPNVTHLFPGDAVVVECIQSCGICEACQGSNWIGCLERAEIGVIGRNGGYAEYVVVPGRFVHKIPDELDLRRAYLVEPLAVVLKGLRRLFRFQPDQSRMMRCGVVGAGPLGHLCARVLATRGHSVTVFDLNPVRRQLFSGSNIATSDDMTQLKLFDILVEATGDTEALNLTLHQSAPRAMILLLGLPYGQRPFTFEHIVAYDKTIVGSIGSSAEDFREAIDTLRDLDLSQFVMTLFPLSRFREAWEACASRNSLKVLLEIDSSLDKPYKLRSSSLTE